MHPLFRLSAVLALCSQTFAVPTATLNERASVASPPAEFTPNPTPGGGTGMKYKDSPRFRLWNYTTDDVTTSLFANIEAAYTCFVEDHGWRSTGLSFNNMSNNDGPWYKLNVYSVGPISGAGM